MEVKNKTNPTPAIMEWIGENRGDNLAIKSGLRVFTVDKHGTLKSQRYNRSQARPLSTGIISYDIDGLSDLIVGATYSISQSDVVIGKLLESNLFAYCFLSVTPQGKVTFVDIEYADAVSHIQAGHIKRIQRNISDD